MSNGLPGPAIYYQDRKRQVLWILALGAALYGLVMPFVDGHNQASRASKLVFGICAHFLIVRWCRLDRAARGAPLGWTNESLVAIPVVGFVVYALRERGLRGFMLIIQGLGLVALFSIGGGLIAAVIAYLRGTRSPLE